VSQFMHFRSCIAIAAVLTFGVGVRSARADEHVLVLLDVTGSMTLGSIPGMTRMDVAKARMSTFLDTVPATPTRYAFWTFSGSTFTEVFDFTAGRTAADVKGAVLAAVPGGLTPLAGSVCAAVDELINFLPNDFHTKRIYMATDGEENNTPNVDQCFGPPSATVYPNLTVGSWHWKVRNKACTGNANTPGVCSGGVPPGGLTLIVDVDHLFDFVPTMSSASLLSLEGGKAARGTATFAAGPQISSASSDSAFFAGLSGETHGRYIGITPSTPPAQATPLPGDANGDGCVNVQDRALVLQQFGTPGNGNTDFNRDGIVNTFDLQTVLQNFGRGCTKVR